METERLRSVLARVRWANVARLLAITAVVVAVVEGGRAPTRRRPRCPTRRPARSSPPRRRRPSGADARVWAKRGPARAEVAAGQGPTRRGDAGPRPQAEPGRPRAAVRRAAVRRSDGAAERGCSRTARRSDEAAAVATSAPRSGRGRGGRRHRPPRRTRSRTSSARPDAAPYPGHNRPSRGCPQAARRSSRRGRGPSRCAAGPRDASGGSSSPMVSATWIGSCISWMSNGLTLRANSPGSRAPRCSPTARRPRSAR